MGMVSAFGENRPNDYSVEEMASDGFLHEGYIHMSVSVLVAKGYLKKINRPWSATTPPRVSYYITDEGDGAAQSNALLYEGFFRRFKVLGIIGGIGAGILAMPWKSIVLLLATAPISNQPDVQEPIDLISKSPSVPTISEKALAIPSDSITATVPSVDSAALREEDGRTPIKATEESFRDSASSSPMPDKKK